MLSSFTPNKVISRKSTRLLILGQVVGFVLLWSFATPNVIPKPWDVLTSLQDLFCDGIVGHLMVSLALYGEAVFAASVFSLLLVYASALPFFRPIAEGWSKFRFMGVIGIPFLLTLCISGVHSLKLALLVFSISVFMVTSMLDVADYIPREKYDLARTLQMSEWQVLWEVMVLGRADVMLDQIRQSAAVGWMMLPLVEGLWKSEGGIGAVLDIQNHHFHLAAIATIQLLVLMIGLLQDYGIGVVKKIACPYSGLLLERR